MTEPLPSVPRPIRVLTVDDDAMVRTGIRSILSHDPDHRQPELIAVAEASDGDEVIDAVHEHHPDIVLMDIRMQRMQGIEATSRLQREVNPPKVIALTSFDLDRYVLGMLEAGASGFLLKDAAPSEVRNAIRVVHEGNAVLSPRATTHLIACFAPTSDRARMTGAARLVEALSEREREVAGLVHQSLSDDQIATRLHCSVSTVKTHLSHVRAKLDVSTRVQVALLMERAAAAAR